MLKTINFEEVATKTFEDGGHTVEITGRYMVALEDYEVTVRASLFNSEHVRLYLEHVQPDLPGATLGTWLNEENGRVYLDTSIGLDNLDEALKLGRQEQQEAIYDTLT